MRSLHIWTIALVLLDCSHSQAAEQQLTVICNYKEYTNTGDVTEDQGGMVKFTFDWSRHLYKIKYMYHTSIFLARGNGTYRIGSFDDLQVRNQYESGSSTEREVFNRMDGTYKWRFTDTGARGFVERSGKCDEVTLDPIGQGVF
jgi:hypothetical protein